MRPQHTAPRLPRACIICGIDTTWQSDALGRSIRNETCSPPCEQEQRARKVALARLRRIWGSIEATDGCWRWAGPVDPNGYGWVYVDGRLQRVHRYIYAVIVGPFPDDLTLDHTCHNADLTCPGGLLCPHRRCVNPGHLEPVERVENYLRGYERWLAAGRLEHCKYGHEMTTENTYVSPVKGKRRVCRTCTRLAQRRRQARLNAVD